MKTCSLILGLVVLAGCTAFTPTIGLTTPQAKAVSELPVAYAALQGQWKVTRAQVGTVEMSDKIGAVLHFEGNRFWSEGDRGYEVVDIDTTSAPFKIDFWGGGTAVQGVFRAEGNVLVVCSAPPYVARPTSFDPTAHYRYILWEAVRADD